MKYFSCLALSLLLLSSVAADQGQNGYVPLTPEQIETRRAERLRFYEYERSRRELSIKRSLLNESIRYNANQSLYDVNYYGIDVNINFASQSIVARIDYQLTSLGNPLAVVDLDLIDQLTVDSVFVTGISAPFSHFADLLSITLPVGISYGEQFLMSVYYHGQPYSGYGYTDGGMGFAVHGGYQICWTATEPFGSRNWWPCKDTPSDKADSIAWWIECPGNMIAAANGVLVSTTTLGSGRKVYHWKHNYPITTYLIALSVAQFVEQVKTWQYDGYTMPVYSYTLPNAYDSRTVFDTLTIPMLNHYSDAFGIYPFVEEKLANVNCGVYGTMEHQTCSFHDPFAWYYDKVYLLIHENAHQWWGDMITCRTFHDIWLNEGFGTYSEAIFYERQFNSTQAYFDHMQTLKYLGPGTVYVEDPANEVIFDGNLSYNKGAWVVHMLRGVLGDSLFFAFLKDWAFSEYRYGSASTADLSAFLSDWMGTNMGWFFNQWIFREGHPQYEISWQCRAEESGYTLSYVVEQVQGGGFTFRMPIKTRLVTTGGIRDTVLWNQGIVQLYTISLADSVLDIAVDPQEWILRTVTKVPFTMHVATAECPDGEIGVLYYLPLEAVGGVPPYHWSFHGGDLPYGLSLEGGTVGVISGTPTYAATYYFTITLADSDVPPSVQQKSLSIKITPPTSLCGDADGSGQVTISDAVYLISFIFGSGPPPASSLGGDPDCSGLTSITDVVYLINFIFAAGPPPCANC